jgi:hypothetical protein
MAPVPAIITVSWQSNYNGPHRVCFRIVGAPTYTCTTGGTHPNCGVGPCSYDIPITADNETCDPVNYEGYVQAACEDESSLLGRIPFAVSFIPSPACKQWSATCLGVGVASINVTDPADGYTPGLPPVVSIVGGGGAGATAVAVVGTGFILTTGLVGVGVGYNDGVYVAVPLIGGTGAGATADITIVGGAMTVVVLNAPGDGYTAGDPLTPDTGTVGVPGAAGQIDAVTTDLGYILAINITAPGNGYTSIPTVTVAPSPTGTATGDAVLALCPPLTIYDCNGVTGEVLPAGTLLPLVPYNMCGETEPTVPDEYGVAEIGNCLCNCTEYDMSNTGAGPGNVEVTWIDCNGSVQTATLLLPTSITNICAVTGSVSYDDSAAGAVMTLTPIGACTP